MLIAIIAIAAVACFGRRRAHHRSTDWEESREGPSEFRQRAAGTMRERFEEWHRKQHDQSGKEPAPTPDGGATGEV